MCCRLHLHNLALQQENERLRQQLHPKQQPAVALPLLQHDTYAGAHPEDCITDGLLYKLLGCAPASSNSAATRQQLAADTAWSEPEDESAPEQLHELEPEDMCHAKQVVTPETGERHFDVGRHGLTFAGMHIKQADCACIHVEVLKICMLYCMPYWGSSAGACMLQTPCIARSRHRGNNGHHLSPGHDLEPVAILSNDLSVMYVGSGHASYVTIHCHELYWNAAWQVTCSLCFCLQRSSALSAHAVAAAPTTLKLEPAMQLHGWTLRMIPQSCRLWCLHLRVMLWIFTNPCTALMLKSLAPRILAGVPSVQKQKQQAAMQQLCQPSHIKVVP